MLFEHFWKLDIKGIFQAKFQDSSTQILTWG